MKKSLLLITLLLSIVAMPIAAQQKLIKKHATMSLIKKRGNAMKSLLGAPKAAETAQLNSLVIAGYFPASASSEEGMDNYYLILADNNDVSYDGKNGTIKATNANVAILDLYAPENTDEENNVMSLPTGTFNTEGDLHYNYEGSYVTAYDAEGNDNGGADIDGGITITKQINDDNVELYTISFQDSEGTTYVYNGEVSLTNMVSGGATVYPQMTTDIKDAKFTGGLGYYYGNLMESNTGNLVLDLYTGEYDEETGGMTGKGLDFTINLYNRLFGNPKDATVVPGTYTVARNFKVNTFFPGMEIDYMGMTILMGTYVKRRKAVTGLTTDYDYCYIADGTITITEGEKEGTFDFVIDCVTDRGHKVTGTAKGISFKITDKSEKSNKDVHSNLTEDVNLNFDRVAKSRIYSLGEQNGVQVFTVDLGSPSGKDDPTGEGDQDLLRMEFQAAAGSKYLPEGTYTLMKNSHLYTNEYAPFKMTRGYFDDLGGRTGTVYQHFQKCADPATRLWWVMDKYAIVYSGTVGVTKTDNNHYKFVIDLYDGQGFKITGEYDKEMEYNYDPESISTGINGIVDNANGESKTEVYTVDGQLIKTVNATAAASVQNMPAGIYLVKTNNKTQKIIKK